MVKLLFDTTTLEDEQDKLIEETQLLANMMNQLIYENAHVALDQAEYQKHYDSLTQRFDAAKERLETVMAEISKLQTNSANVEAFLKAFEDMPDCLTEFTVEAWHSLVDYATVYSNEDIHFTFKNGQEVQG